MKKRRPLGYETKHSMWFMQWARMQSATIPELKLLFHITNEGKRTRAQAGIAKAMGLTRGVHDYLLPVRRAFGMVTVYSGLWIEMKKPGEKLTDEQDWWRRRMEDQGFKTITCFSWPEARQAVLDYLRPHETLVINKNVELEHA